MHRGFTLVELAIVLAVISVVAAYVTPDFIELAKTKLADRAAEDMMEIQDAARWFYHDSPGPGMDPQNMRWPGETGPNTCATAGSTPQAELTVGRYLEPTQLINPWGKPYQTSLWTPTPARPQNCRFQIVTEVPAALAPILMTRVPLCVCERAAGQPDACPGTPAAGEDLCCTRLVKPGFESSEEDVIASVCEHLLGGVWSDGECDPYGDWDFSDCEWIAETVDGSICQEGKVVVGTRETSCGKYCQRTDYQCCVGKPNRP